MAKNEPVKCERCGTLSSVGNLCLTCREQTRKGDLKKVLLAVVAIPVGCAVLVLVGLAGQWIYDHIEPVWRAHSCKGELQTALGRDRLEMISQYRGVWIAVYAIERGAGQTTAQRAQARRAWCDR